MLTLFIILGVVIILVLYFVVIHNRLVALKNNRENAFADIDVQLKQRHDLIPQLIETVKGYMTHEKNLLTEITKARSQAVQATGVNGKIAAESALSSALSGLKIAVEAYPDLKANQNFMQVQTEMSDIENKLAAVRRFFNSATKELNTYIQMFPSNIIASTFGYKKESMFDLDTDRKEYENAPKVDFSN